jgi:hypothetical protein
MSPPAHKPVKWRVYRTGVSQSVSSEDARATSSGLHSADRTFHCRRVTFRRYGGGIPPGACDWELQPFSIHDPASSHSRSVPNFVPNDGRSPLVSIELP